MRIPFVDLKRQHDPIRGELLQAFSSTLDSQWFIQGERLKKFETEYSKFNQIKYTAGDALTIALKALGIGPGDEVIIPSNTFIATALAVSAAGADIVLAEPDDKTYNITAKAIEAVVSNKTKCIVPVHLYGQSCEMTDLMSLAKKLNLFVVEDNAQAQGATYDSRMTGTWGDINATSFYPGKNLGALGDAGAITTESIELFEKAKLLRNYGSVQRYDHQLQGFNSRLDELQASLLSAKLPHLQEWTKKRQEIARSYHERLNGIKELTLPETAPRSSHSYHLYVVRTAKRDELAKHLASDGIDTLIHYPIPIHKQVAYEGYFTAPRKIQNLQLTENLAKTSLSLPIFPGLTEHEVGRVEASIKKFFSN
jgi:dTDP-4-amino-4,6-dideoxygalactose transaminase